MKRGAILVAVLALIAASVFLVLSLGDDSRGRRSSAAVGEAGRGGGDPEGDAAAEARPGDPLAPAAGRGPDDDPNRVPGAALLVRGVVLRAETPIAGAEVSIHRAFPEIGSEDWSWRQRAAELMPQEPVARTTTDALGRFTLVFARRKSFTVEARAKDLAAQRLLLLAPESGNPDELTIRLAEGNTVLVRVLRPGGEPLPSAAALLRIHPWRMPPFRFEGTSDETGSILFTGIPDGWGEVRVDAEGFPSARVSATIRPRTEILVRLVPGGSIAGTVKNDAGAPLAGALLLVQTGRNWEGVGGTARVVTDAAGAYRVESIVPGPITSASVLHADYPWTSSDSGDVVLPMAPVKTGEELRFDVVVTAGVPVRGVALRAADETPVGGAVVVLLRRSPNSANLVEFAARTAGPDGAFSVPHVPDGDYAIEAWAPGLARRVTRNQSSQSPLSIDFTLSGEPPGPQRVLLGGAGRVSGRVVGVDAGTLQRSYVSIAAEGYAAGSNPDSTGRFRFDGVPPVAAATASCSEPQVTSPEFAVEEGKTAEVTLDASRQIGFTGIVVDADGGAIRGAYVMAFPVGQQQNSVAGQWNAARTDHTGRFVFALQSWAVQNQGKWDVIATHPDHTDGILEAVKAPAEGEATALRIVLRRGGKVSGRVERPDGSPVPSCNVSVGPKITDPKVRDLRQMRGAVTGLDGCFEISGVGEGAWLCHAWHPEGSVDPVEVASGATGVRLVMRKTETISGVVLDERKRPVAQSQVSAFSPASQLRAQSWTDASGRFNLTNLAPGIYSIVASPQQQWGRGAAFVPKTVESVASGTEGLVIQLDPGLEITGRVTDAATGRPIAAAAIIAMALKIDPQKRGDAYSAMRPLAWTGGKGEFALRGVGNEQVEILVFAPRYAPSARVASGGERDLSFRLDAAPTIEGRILKPDGSPLAGAWLSLWPTSPETQQIFQDWQQRGGQAWNSAGGSMALTTRTDGRGRFLLSIPWAGEYGMNLQSDAGVLPDGRVRTGSGPVVLQLVPGLAVKGRITDENGAPFAPDPAQPLWVNAQSGQTWVKGVRAEEDGSFELKGLPPGRLTLQAWVPNHGQGTLEVEAGAQAVRIVVKRNPNAK